MKRTEALILVVAAVCLATIALVATSGGSLGNLPRAAPTFTLPRADGSMFDLDEPIEGALLVNFWATGCPPCVEETASLEGLHRRLGSKGLNVLGVSVDKDWGVVNRFVARHDVTFTVLLDPRATTPRRR